AWRGGRQGRARVALDNETVEERADLVDQPGQALQLWSLFHPGAVDADTPDIGQCRGQGVDCAERLNELGQVDLHQGVLDRRQIVGFLLFARRGLGVCDHIVPVGDRAEPRV